MLCHHLKISVIPRPRPGIAPAPAAMSRELNNVYGRTPWQDAAPPVRGAGPILAGRPGPASEVGRPPESPSRTVTVTVTAALAGGPTRKPVPGPGPGPGDRDRDGHRD